MADLTQDYYALEIDHYLRLPPKGPARSAYAIEVNPWARRADVEAALFFRGSIVSAYGYIETRLGEICIRCSRLEAYASKRKSFPDSTSKRIEFLKLVFAFGPLAPHERFAVLFLQKFERTQELRHQVAHARMQVLPDWGITFEDITQSKGSSLSLRNSRFTYADFETLAWRATRLSRLLQFLLDRLGAFDILPPMHAAK